MVLGMTGSWDGVLMVVEWTGLDSTATAARTINFLTARLGTIV